MENLPKITWSHRKAWSPIRVLLLVYSALATREESNYLQLAASVIWWLWTGTLLHTTYLSGAAVLRCHPQLLQLFRELLRMEELRPDRLLSRKEELGINRAFHSIVKTMDFGKGRCPPKKKKPWKEKFRKGLSSLWSVDGPIVDGLFDGYLETYQPSWKDDIPIGQ